MSGKIAITCLQMQNDLHRHRERLEALGYELVVPSLLGQRFGAVEMIEHCRDCVGIIAGDDDLGRATLSGLPGLRVLVRWGIGTDSVDFDAAAELGILVRNTPGVFGDEVADSAFGYLINLARGHHLVDRSVRAGTWEKVEGVSLTGATLGVLGAGNIGRAVIRRGLGFGMKVLAYDPFVGDDLLDGASLVGLRELLETSRFVVLTAPATDATRHIISAKTLSVMRSDAYLINVARGDLVNEVDLAAALRAGALAGAGLDVFEVEPPPADSPLRSLENVMLGAHNGSNTREGVERASQRAVDILVEELAKVAI